MGLRLILLLLLHLSLRFQISDHYFYNFISASISVSFHLSFRMYVHVFMVESDNQHPVFKIVNRETKIASCLTIKKSNGGTTKTITSLLWNNYFGIITLE